MAVLEVNKCFRPRIATTGAASGFTMGGSWQDRCPDSAMRLGRHGIFYGIQIGSLLTEPEIIKCFRPRIATAGAASGFTMGASWQDRCPDCARRLGDTGIFYGIQIGSLLTELEVIKYF